MPVNETIGFVACPMTGEQSEVRKNKNGKLYFVGAAGQITPNRPAGQAWLKANMQPLNETEKAELNTQPTELGQRKRPDPAPVSVTDAPAEKMDPQTDPKPETKQEQSWGFFG